MLDPDAPPNASAAAPAQVAGPLSGPATAEDQREHQQLFENAGVGLLKLSLEGHILLANPDCAAFFGYPREAPTGMNVLEITHQEDIPKTLQALASVIGGETDRAVLEKRYVRADGRVVWSRSRVSLLRDQRGEAHTVVAVVADITELKEAQQALETMNAHLQATLEGGLLGLGLALEARDLETSGHTQRVVTLSLELARALGLPQQALDELRQGAALHDLGKLTIPDAILLKPGPLTPAEWAVMQSHVTNGHGIAARIPALAKAALAVIRHHHERWDGTGYPDRLAGEAIPLLARIFTICDVYDALTSDRPYKKAWTPQAALEELRAQRGRQFDAAIVDAFLEQQAFLDASLPVSNPLPDRVEQA